MRPTAFVLHAKPSDLYTSTHELSCTPSPSPRCPDQRAPLLPSHLTNGQGQCAVRCGAAPVPAWYTRFGVRGPRSRWRRDEKERQRRQRVVARRGPRTGRGGGVRPSSRPARGGARGCRSAAFNASARAGGGNGWSWWRRDAMRSRHAPPRTAAGRPGDADTWPGAHTPSNGPLVSRWPLPPNVPCRRHARLGCPTRLASACFTFFIVPSSPARRHPLYVVTTG